MSSKVYHIPNSLAPKEYTFEYKMDQNIKMDMTFDGGIDFYKGNDLIGNIMPPWAKDSTGKYLKTHYKIKENKVTQVIEHEDAEFPIIADPYSVEIISEA